MNFRQRVRGEGGSFAPFPPQNKPPENSTQIKVNLDRTVIAFADWLFIESVSLASNWQQYFLNSLVLNNLRHIFFLLNFSYDNQFMGHWGTALV